MLGHVRNVRLADIARSPLTVDNMSPSASPLTVLGLRRRRYRVPGVVVLGGGPARVDPYCGSCGAPYPWTAAGIEAYETFSQEAARTVRDVLANSLHLLKASDLSADVSLDPLTDGGYELGIHFSRGFEFVDAGFALIGSDDDPRVTLDELREWTTTLMTEALAKPDGSQGA